MACRRLVVAVAAMCAVSMFTACDTDDGRTLDPPSPGATAPPLLSGGAASVGDAPTTIDNGVRLTSSAFTEGGEIPVKYGGCAPGENVSPPLQWSGIPANVVEIALVVTDPSADGGGFVHWVVAGLPPSLVGLSEGSVPESAVQAINDVSESGWYGPCPPEGETHNYVFTLYALSEASGLESGVGAAAAIDRINVIPAYAAHLSGTYTR